MLYCPGDWSRFVNKRKCTCAKIINNGTADYFAVQQVKYSSVSYQWLLLKLIKENANCFRREFISSVLSRQVLFRDDDRWLVCWVCCHDNIFFKLVATFSWRASTDCRHQFLFRDLLLLSFETWLVVKPATVKSNTIQIKLDGPTFS